ncbi:juvenile hormone esterase-like [Cydia splendana]|uniref:juvenile hormone esterase-like n=1 Tax=Cydia splendana TaxID=1100963 RepID=UPI00213E6E8B
MTRLLVICVVQVFVLQIHGAAENTPVLQIPQGKLMGLEMKKGYWQYLGIPYGTVDDRFQEAGPPPRWLGVFNASDTTVVCAQYHDRLQLPVGVEDCLILNVYTPGQVSYKRLYPVMVFIHGGGYKTGSSSAYLYNPQPLVKKGVIVVTVNYRLGPFGFLCLRIKGAPGNAGLKDQVAALKWVKDNIKNFGGNPDLVTIFGESAGSASVSYLILSPAAKGLFRRAIMQSASALSPFALPNDPIDRASLVAAKMGYNTKNPFDLLRIFTNSTKNDILIASASVTSSNLLSKYVFRPCVEKQGVNNKPFLAMNPQDILESGKYNKVSMIIGYNNKEGIRYVTQLNKKVYQSLNANFAAILPDNMYFSSIKERKDTANKIKTFYFGNYTINNSSVNNLIDLISDVMFHYPSVAITEYFLNHNHLPIYNYYFKYDSYRNLAKILLGLKDLKGAAHGDELFYLFNPAIYWPLPLKGSDAKTVERMTSMWTNFAKFGNPTSLKSSALDIDWQASDDTNLRYIIIDKNLTMDSLPNPDRIDFWRKIYNETDLST